MVDFNIEIRVPTVDEYNTLRSAVGWRTIEGPHCGHALQSSLFCICARAASHIIGTARVIGDGGIYFYVQDVIVLPEWQGKGVGSELMNAVMNYIYSQARPGAFIGLMAAQGAVGFYERYGFAPRPQDRPGMFIQIAEPASSHDQAQ